MNAKRVVVTVALVLASCWSAQVMEAQAPSSAPVIYRREVFRYDRGGRRDPFQSLLSGANLGTRLEDLALRGIIYNPNPRLSIAVLQQTGVPRPLRVRVGDQVGTIRIIGIYPRRVDVAINEFGVFRRESLVLRGPTTAGRGT